MTNIPIFVNNSHLEHRLESQRKSLDYIQMVQQNFCILLMRMLQPFYRKILYSIWILSSLSIAAPPNTSENSQYPPQDMYMADMGSESLENSDEIYERFNRKSAGKQILKPFSDNENLQITKTEVQLGSNKKDIYGIVYVVFLVFRILVFMFVTKLIF